MREIGVVKKMTDGVKVVGSLHKVSKDSDGEVTLVLKVPSTYKNIAMNLPEHTSFDIIFRETLE